MRSNGDYFAPPALNNRQAQILRRLARGQTRADIAAELGIAVRTVSSNLNRARRSHDARNVAHLMLIACRGGLMEMARETTDA